MANFEPLYQILKMDFSQLRTLDGRATDTSIISFVDELKEFFTQFDGSQVNLVDKKRYHALMSQIINGINVEERIYFSKKLNSSKIKPASPINPETYDVTPATLPNRLDSFAGGERSGNTVRYSKNYMYVCNCLRQWLSSVEKPAYESGRNLFFSQDPAQSRKRRGGNDMPENAASSSDAASSSSKQPRRE